MKQLYQSVKDQHRVIIDRIDSVDVYYTKQNDTAALHVLEKEKFFNAYIEVKKPLILNAGKMVEMGTKAEPPSPPGKKLGGQATPTQNVSSHLYPDVPEGGAYKAVDIKDVPPPSSVMDVLGVASSNGSTS